VLALPLGALLAHWSGPRAIFGILAVFSLLAWFVTRRLPAVPHHMPKSTKAAARFQRPNSLDAGRSWKGWRSTGSSSSAFRTWART
jgi:DHA1 family inner membrane transport protein